MSRTYQGLIVLNTKSLDGTIDDLVSAVAKEIEGEGAKIAKIEQLGRRQFAYPSNHLESGHYVSYQLEGDSDVVTKVQDRLRLNDNVHMQHYQRLS
ncbi:MAG: 30S ribosomal protein S6 [Verrucomicrobiae bacterium]|nr:30S ribosomal protein S6 [Verrucomicrobiae bacterium]